MRDYAKVSPRFWLGETGRELRKAGAEAQVVAFYLMTSPHANMLGLYYLPVLYLVNRPGFPGEYFICELRLPDHYFRWKHNKLFLLLPEEYGPAFPAIVDCYTSPPTLVWPVPLLSGFSSSYGVLPPLCKDH